MIAAPYTIKKVAIQAVDVSTGAPKTLLTYICPPNRIAIVLSFWCRFGAITGAQPGTEVDVIDQGATHELLQQGGQDVDCFGLFQGLLPGDTFLFLLLSNAGSGIVHAWLTVLEIVP